MERPFAGFSTQREQAVLLPVELFTEVLPRVTDLAELKVLLAVFRLVAAQREVPRGKPRAVSWDALVQDEQLRQGLAILGPEPPVEERLDRALEKAVARGTLLALVVQRGGHAESWYVIHTAANRRLVEQLGQQPSLLEGTPLAGAQVTPEQPTIFRLYEQNIGIITPLLAEELEEAAGKYPADWIPDAFREAVAHNRRSWRYIQAILKRWEREGRGERADRREKPIDFDQYTHGEYADLFGQEPGRREEKK